ncbi:MAG: Do family serine endopeptidase [Pseudomonadota bacterium]
MFIKFFRILLLFVFIGEILSSGLELQATPNKVVPTSKAQIQLSFAPVVKEAAPAVVNIYASRVMPQKVSPLMDDPIFKHFFGEDFFKGQPRTRTQGSLGSGVIVRSDGVVITNNHVIRNAKVIRVVLADGREFKAKVVVREPRTDLAALKLQGEMGTLPYLELGDADQLEVGDVVLAIGNPFGLGQTVTSGVISALARTKIGVSDLRSFIQTDASINRGNSGGALVTLDGKLVGINTMIFSKSGGSIGIGFAIPVNLVNPVILSVDNRGKIVRPWLGADVRSVSKKMANSLGLDRRTGVLVKGIYPKSPAQKAGLQVGDLILSVDGYTVKDDPGLDFRIASKPTGYRSKLKVRRKKGTVETLDVTLEAPPGTGLEKPVMLKGKNPLSGVRIITLSPAIATQLGLDFMQRGVVILKVERRSIANRIGLLPGDIIKTVNGTSIGSVKELVRELKKHRGKWKMKLQRGKKELVLSPS